MNPPPQRLWRETEGGGLEGVTLLNPPPCVQNERFRGGRFGGGDNKRAFFPVIPCAVRRISASRDLKAGVVLTAHIRRFRIKKQKSHPSERSEVKGS